MVWVELPKLDVARSQLETAVGLFFNSGDSASIHTLGCAAQEILEAICREKGIESTYEMVLKNIIEDKRKLVRDKLFEAKNFFKHGKSDPNSTLKFNPDSSTFVLWDACVLYKKFTGEFARNEKLFLFECWFALKHPDIFPQISELAATLVGVDLDDKPLFYRAASIAFKRINQTV